MELINQKKSPIQDDYIEKYLVEKDLNLTATLDAKVAYKDADFVVIAALTNYNSKKNFFDTSAVENVIELVIEYNPDAVMVIKSTIPVGYTASIREKYHCDNIIFSPEFLRESKALYDNLYPSRIIVGTDQTVLIARNKNNCQKRRFVYVAFGVVMMVSMTQNFLQNHGGLQGNNEYEASPMFVVNSDNTEEKSRYNIRLENGIAAYVKMRGYEKYTFFHEGKEYDVRFVFLSKEKNGQVNMYDKGATLDYEVCNTGFNHDEAFKYMNKYVKEKFGNETVVSNTRYIDLNYYDYTNQNYTLRYSGTKNRIENYSVRKGELDTYPEHNCTVAFRENEDTFDQVRKLIDQVSNL